VPQPEAQEIHIGSVQVREIEPGLKLPIDLPTVLAFAGARNLDVLEAKARAAEAAAMQDEAIGKLAPTAYGSGLFFGQRTSGQTQGYFTDLGRSFDRTNAAGGAELSLNPAQAIFAALAAHRSAGAATNQGSEVGQEALAAAANGYFALLETRAEVQIAQQALQTARELQRVSESRESSGRGLKVDVLRAAAQVAADQIRLSQAGERMRNTSVQLALLLTLDPKVTLVPIDSV
jgi:outer membrane protein TolC